MKLIELVLDLYQPNHLRVPLDAQFVSLTAPAAADGKAVAVMTLLTRETTKRKGAAPTDVWVVQPVRGDHEFDTCKGVLGSVVLNDGSLMHLLDHGRNSERDAFVPLRSAGAAVSKHTELGALGVPEIAPERSSLHPDVERVMSREAGPVDDVREATEVVEVDRGGEVEKLAVTPGANSPLVPVYAHAEPDDDTKAEDEPDCTCTAEEGAAAPIPDHDRNCEWRMWKLSGASTVCLCGEAVSNVIIDQHVESCRSYINAHGEPGVRLVKDDELIASSIGVPGSVVSMAAPSTEDLLRDEIKTLMDGMELAWGLIANSYASVEAQGNGNPQHGNIPVPLPHPLTVQFTKEWKAAADRWRDEQWHPALKRNPEVTPDAVEEPA